MTTFAGEVHPYAEEWEPLPDEEMAEMALSVLENGLRRPIELDAQGRLVDGRQRLEACRIAGVEPTFTVLEWLVTDEEISAYVADSNAHRRHVSQSRVWMQKGIDLKRQGKRRNGRWERGSLAIGKSPNSATEQDAMKKVGLILDVAERAEALGGGFETWARLPHSVGRDMSLDAAHRSAQDFEARSALAEALAYQPLEKVLGLLEEMANEAEAKLPLPSIDVPLRRDHHTRMTEIARRFTAIAKNVRTHSEENKK